VKPAIISCFGDIAMAIKGDFIRYINFVFQILEQACQTVASIQIFDVSDTDLLEFVCLFCTSILDTYSSIIHGLDETSERNNLVASQLGSIASLIVYIAQNRQYLRDENIEKAAIGCLGDLFQSLDKNHTEEMAKVPIIKEFVQACKTSEEDDIKKIGSWVYETMPK